MISREEWLEEGKKRFGEAMLFWKFVCPICKTVIEARDYKKAGAPPSAIGFNCIGRYLKSPQKAFGDKKIIKGQPCDYTGGGLFKLNPVEVDCDGQIIRVMEFYKHEGKAE
jgi:hypothetical protein